MPSVFYSQTKKQVVNLAWVLWSSCCSEALKLVKTIVSLNSTRMTCLWTEGKHETNGMCAMDMGWYSHTAWKHVLQPNLVMMIKVPFKQIKFAVFGTYPSKSFISMYLCPCLLNVAFEPDFTTSSGCSFHLPITFCVEKLPLRYTFYLSTFCIITFQLLNSMPWLMKASMPNALFTTFYTLSSQIPLLQYIGTARLVVQLDQRLFL